MKELRDNQFTFRIPQRIRDALNAHAARERRSVADVVNHIFAQLYPAKRGIAMKKKEGS